MDLPSSVAGVLIRIGETQRHSERAWRQRVELCIYEAGKMEDGCLSQEARREA